MLARVAIIVLVASLLAVLGSLLVIGDPPPIRYDALWVNEHRATVRVAIGALAIAVVTTVGAASDARYRLPALLLWIAAGITAWRWFSDSIEIIARVVMNHTG
jgi:hypothetical protein